MRHHAGRASSEALGPYARPALQEFTYCRSIEHMHAQNWLMTRTLILFHRLASERARYRTLMRITQAAQINICILCVSRHGFSMKPACWGNGYNGCTAFQGYNLRLQDWASLKKEKHCFIVWLISRELKPMSSKVPILVFLPHIYSQTADAQ